MHTLPVSWKKVLMSFVLAAMACVVSADAVAEEHPREREEQSGNVEEITIIGSCERFRVPVEMTAATAVPDAAAMLERIPGADVNRNGPLSGIAQYRGLFGDRLNVVVDGVPVVPVGPNHMDAPLSYISRQRLESLEIHRGIAPVSAGLETLGGAILVSSDKGSFADGDALEFHGDLRSSAASVNEGYGAGGLVSLASDRNRLYVGASTESGDDVEFTDGTVKPTRHRREIYDLGYGLRVGDHNLGLDYRRLDTGRTGTPALPMDIQFVETDVVSANYQGKAGDSVFEARLFWSDGEHEMDNFTLRTPMNPAKRRLTVADGRASGLSLAATKPMGGHYLRLGVDGDRSAHDADIENPDDREFFVVNFNDASRNRYGLWAEWIGRPAPGWQLEAGLRYNQIETNADEVATSMGMAAKVLQERFNSADRSITDHNFDWVLQGNYELWPSLVLEAGAARKTRSPSYQERYLWLPLKSTGGLADGKNYVGDIDLEPEVSHEIEFGLEWNDRGLRLSPRAFYRTVDDYIQGTPATDAEVLQVSRMMGDPAPLQFSNVEAELYGADVAWSAAMGDHWLLDGTVGYVRGKRRDIDDDLYRIPPFNGLLALTYETVKWALTVETEVYLRQDDVSATNDEGPTGGYALMNVRGNRELGGGVELTFGVNNVFDRRYADHIGGVNRAGDGDVGVGKRLPGLGVNAYLALRRTW